jgi:CheY-like chemotaxis protein
MGGGPDIPAKTILVIDDDGGNRDVMRDILVEAGFDVIAVADAADALSPLGRDVDLVLLDLVMPLAAMDGFAFLAKAGTHPELLNVPVIVMSGLGETVLAAIDPRTATTLRIASVTPKPINFSELVATIRVILNVPEPV